jgi:uncharacterized protein YfaS (alpha-2-macroglobulin family)
MRVAFGIRIWTGLFLAFAASPAVSAAPIGKNAAAQSLTILKYELAANQDSPELCFLFDGRLARQPGAAPDSFVTVEPSAKLAISVRDRKLCLGGLGFGTRYAVSLKAGLAGVDAALGKDAQFQITVPDRPPEFDFASPAADILPRLPQQGLPIRSVNTPKIAIDLFYVSDRDLRLTTHRSRLTVADVAKFAPSRGEHVWHGTLEPRGAPNRDTVTDLPILTAIGPLKPGLYVAAASVADAPPGRPNDTLPTQYFMISDLGLTSYAGRDSLVVSVRSISTGAAAAAVDVALIAANNRELARVRSDGSGFARFDPSVLHGVGGDRPVAVDAFGTAGEFSTLDIDAARRPDGDGQVLIVGDRKRYRPGDTAHLTVFARDEHGNAIQKQPLTLTLSSPDGAVFDTRVLNQDSAGAYDASIEIPANAAGQWAVVRAALAGRKPGGATIDIDETAPSKLAVTLAAGAALLDPSQPGAIEIQAQYPFGPAAGVPGELKATLAESAKPFAALSDFSFGLIQEAAAASAGGAERFTTDAAGKATITLKPFTVPDTTRPLEAVIDARLYDDAGKPVGGRIRVPLAAQPLFFGLKPVGGPSFPSKQPVRFEAIAVGPDGAKQDKPEAGWEIVREDSMPSWSAVAGEFSYRATIKETRIIGGKIDIAAAAPAVITADLPDGDYRIDLFDPKGDAAGSLRFSVGGPPPDPNTAGSNAPGSTIEIKPAKPMFTPGESAEIFIKPPFESDVVLVTGDRDISGAMIQHLPAAGGVVHLDVPQDAAAGMYVFADAVAPLNNRPSGPSPRHATGSAWLQADPPPHHLDLKLEAPEKVQPGQPVSLSLTATGAGDEPVFATVTATGEPAAAPDQSGRALDAFFAMPSRSIHENDLYGRIITQGGQPAQPFGVRPETSMKPVSGNATAQLEPPFSYDSGIVPMEKTGKLSLIIPTLPAVSGKLDIAVNVWSASRVGGAETQVAVHDPLTVTLPLPAYLRPDDRADVQLSLDNTDGPRGEYRIAVAAEGAVSIADKTEIVANLAEHEQRVQSLSIQAHGIGPGMIIWSATGPGGIAFEREIDLPVRPANASGARAQSAALKPGGLLAVDPALTAGLRPETVSTSLSVGVSPVLDLTGLGRQLALGNRNSVEEMAGAGFLAAVPAKTGDSWGFLPPGLTTGIERQLIGRQGPDGGFALWGSGPSDPFLTAYVLDLLTRAASSENALDFLKEPKARGFDYLALRAREAVAPDSGVLRTPGDIEAYAYAAAVLAKAGRIDLFHLRYFSDRFSDQMHTQWVLASTAAAFAALGDKETASALLTKAVELTNPVLAHDSFASDLRDQAAFAAILAETGIVSKDILSAEVTKTAALAAGRRQFSAQEAAWMLRAGLTAPSGGEVKLKVGDKTLDQSAPFVAVAKAGGEALPPIKNLMSAPVNATVTVTGVPNGADNKDNGFELQRFFFDGAGRPVDPASLKKNDLMVVVLTGRFTGQGEPHPLLSDPTPAGWVIEAAEIPGAANRFPWLKDLTGATYIDAGHGRYFAAPILAGDRHEFKVAYVARAAVKGQFALPGASIEDMTQPGLSAHTPGGKTKVDAVE